MIKIDNILGALLGAAAGDAMGAVTETMTPQQIKNIYNGGVMEFINPSDSSPASGRLAGQVTDDFSQAYQLMKAIIKSKGVVTRELAEEAILEWASLKEGYFERFAGPTTRAAIQHIREGGFRQDWESQAHPNAQATNGAAMKIFPLGLLNPGNVENAIEDAVTVSRVTHNNHLAISGACAIAAAVSVAATGDPLKKVLTASIYGAEQGEKLGKERSLCVAGPSVAKRILLAIELANRARSTEEAMGQIYDLIGTGIHVSEAVPAAIGLLAATNGEPVKGILAAVNIGNDTDTIATILGAIAGARLGAKSFPKEWLSLLNQRNGFNLETLATDFYIVTKK